ncbi:S-layer homology domain-containing protein [uncultured Intestinimonas sp.]|uniref:S-layer homology domain-containing protein n=1 Tax=uncultured Intestinimonas sp. TaxID=1689265 RepID=UPI0025D9A077|nr:S-layer homology domain-containing protein [uncultured Intestinimonas sp.]
MKPKHTRLRSLLASFLAVAMLASLMPTAFAAQQNNSYRDPAEHWKEANDRTNELDTNSVVTRETFACGVCGQVTMFVYFRVPEYTRDGTSALNRGVKYSDGTLISGSGTGNVNDGVPGVDAYYTGHHWTKAVCETCGSINTNMPESEYGYGDGTVGPDRNMSRAEAAAIFARILSETRGENLPDGHSSRFPDVDPDAWYAGYVAYLEQLGVVVGYDDGKFHAGASITREQFVTVCARLADWMELETYETDQGSFPDVTRDHWAARYVREATRNGWVVGYPDGLFHGGDEITRAEVVTIVNRMLGRTADETYIRRNKDELNTFYDLQNPHYWAYYDLMEAANGHTIVTGAENETWHEVK